MSKRIKRLQKVWVGLPKRVKIGANWWTVTFVDNMTGHDGRGMFGEMRDQSSELVFNPDQSFGQARDTVVHEIVHAIRTNTLIGHGGDVVSSYADLDEAIALMYSPYLLMVIQDNPGLVEWLQKPEEEE